MSGAWTQPNCRDRAGWHAARGPVVPGFTLLEMLVATVVVAMAMLVIVQAIGKVQDTWVSTHARVREFQDARSALETISRRLSRAVLNSSWVWNNDADGEPTNLVLESDLHFVCGPAQDVLGSTSSFLGHAVFFQAPMGFAGGDRSSQNTAGETAEYETLPNVLNAWGYYLQFGEDEQDLPAHLTSGQTAAQSTKRYRFRLMEFRQPAHELELFKMGTERPPASVLSNLTGQEELYEWFRDPVTETSGSSGYRCSVVAENVLALVIKPAESPDVPGVVSTDAGEDDLAPEYLYDSRRFQWDPANDLAERTRHRLPPSLSITVVVLDENQWAAMTDSEASQTGSQLRSSVAGWFVRASDYDENMGSLIGELNRRKLKYRIISSTIQIPAGRRSSALDGA